MSHISKLERAGGHLHIKTKNSESKEIQYKRHSASGAQRKLFDDRITRNFKHVVLCGYCDSDDDPHHSSDVFLHGESISDRITGGRALYLSILSTFMPPLQILCFYTKMSTWRRSSLQLGNVAHMHRRDHNCPDSHQ